MVDMLLLIFSSLLNMANNHHFRANVKMPKIIFNAYHKLLQAVPAQFDMLIWQTIFSFASFKTIHLKEW